MIRGNDMKSWQKTLILGCGSILWVMGCTAEMTVVENSGNSRDSGTLEDSGSLEEEGDLGGIADSGEIADSGGEADIGEEGDLGLEEEDIGGGDGEGEADSGVEEPEPEPSCPGDEEICGGSCVDLTNNDDHCGQCDLACDSGGACAAGQCHDDEIIAGVIEATNVARSSPTNCGQYGDYSAVGPLTGHPLLHEAAQGHTVDMLENDFFSHTGSDGSSFSQRISATGYSGWPVGENIAGGSTDPEDVVQRWLDSDGHCRNIMNGSATQIGVGFVLGGQWGSLWTMKLANGS